MDFLLVQFDFTMSLKNNLEQTQENVRTPKISYNESKNKRNHYSAEFKTKVVLEILSEESTIN